MIVIDTSVWLDLFLEDIKRRKLAEDLIKIAEGFIYEPQVFKIELAGVLSRKFNKKDALSFIKEIEKKIKIIKNPNILAFQVALNTGCRAIDAYFIATAKLTNSILITNDKVMINNAKKFKIEAYYLIEDFERVANKIKDLLKT